MIVNDQYEGHPFIPLTYPILSNSLRSSSFGDAWRRVVPSHTAAVNHQCEQSVEGTPFICVCSVWFAACSSSTSDCLRRRELSIPPVSLRPLSSKCRVYRMTPAIRDYSIAWYSALTNPQQFPVPQSDTVAGIGFGIPITYVPLRNTIFLSLSAAFLESEVLHAIEVDGLQSESIAAHIYMAPNAIDYSGYPDCRPEYYEKMSAALEYGSKLWAQYGVRIKVLTPIMEMSKAEIARFGMKLSAPLEHTWSCYEGGETPCAKCDSCLLRAKGFTEAGIPDPLLVRLGR